MPPSSRTGASPAAGPLQSRVPAPGHPPPRGAASRYLADPRVRGVDGRQSPGARPGSHRVRPRPPNAAQPGTGARAARSRACRPPATPTFSLPLSPLPDPWRMGRQSSESGRAPRSGPLTDPPARSWLTTEQLFHRGRAEGWLAVASPQPPSSLERHWGAGHGPRRRGRGPGHRRPNGRGLGTAPRARRARPNPERSYPRRSSRNEHWAARVASSPAKAFTRSDHAGS